MEAAAILISADGATGPVRALVDRLGAIGVGVTIAVDLATAVERYASYAEPPCLVLDLARPELPDATVVDEIRTAVAAMPHAQPIALLAAPDAARILACLRAGAGDVIVLDLDDATAAQAVVERSYLNRGT